MSSSPTINRANAQHSTGPKTKAGKERSARNALRHGLTGQNAVMPTEDLQAYQSHLKSFTDEYDPQGTTETQLVQDLADHAWRLNRVVAYEANLLALAPTETQDAITFFERQSRALANLSLHSQRLSRQFDKTAIRLRSLQSNRLANESTELDSLLDIMEMYESRGETYDPSEHGFVFTEDQLSQAILARNRDRLYIEARDAATQASSEIEDD